MISLIASKDKEYLYIKDTDELSDILTDIDFDVIHTEIIQTIRYHHKLHLKGGTGSMVLLDLQAAWEKVYKEKTDKVMILDSTIEVYLEGQDNPLVYEKQDLIDTLKKRGAFDS